MRGYKYCVGQEGNGEWYWHIAYRGKIISSNTGHNSKQGAKNGIRANCRAVGGNWELIKKKIEEI